MAKKYQPTKRERTEFIKGIVSFVESLPPDAHLSWQIYRGKNDKPDSNNIVTSSPNGTATITILVNGGAQDHELQPDWMAPGYLDRH